ncbi:DUF3558 domain-containing protein [Streptomyces sp. NPDC006879]|uniref:DUF3558 domain-containing protein n=1 Tax=Streptomyces sp. NPDC006879 TaxID=3364767 RepID=UPI0036AB385C
MHRSHGSHRSAAPFTRLLAAAAVPVMLLAVGCSSDSDSAQGGTGSKDGKKSADGASATSQAPSVKPSPTLEEATYAKLPEPCRTISQKTTGELVPNAKDKDGSGAKSNDLSSRGSCSWHGLADEGLKGSKYRWLAVSLTRYDSEESLGSGNERAAEQFAKQVAAASATEGAVDVKSQPATGIGDQATTVAYKTKQTVDFFNQTVVARAQNVVVTLDYNGASYEGAKAPDPSTLLKDAQRAAQEVVAAVAAANK